jgi:hypothetical protein
MRRLCLALAVIGMTAMFCQTASAHSAFKKALQEKYDFKSVSCNSCHVKGKPKSDRNDFGKALHEPLEEMKFDGKGLTEKYEEVKGDKALKEAFEKEMSAAFLKALETVSKEKSPSGKTWGELLKNAEIDGIKPKE